MKAKDWLLERATWRSRVTYDLHLVEGWESLWDKWVQDIIDRKEWRYWHKQLFQGILLKRRA